VVVWCCEVELACGWKIILWREGQAKTPDFRKSFSSRLNFISTDTTASMDSATHIADALRKQIAATEEKLKRLKARLATVEAHDGTNGVEKSLQSLEVDASPVTHGKWPLSAEEYKRYGRQMIVPSVGIQGIFYSILFRILC
jgi:hypothetical protein